VSAVALRAMARLLLNYNLDLQQMLNLKNKLVKIRGDPSTPRLRRTGYSLRMLLKFEE
jgi:hypothetical protein